MATLRQDTAIVRALVMSKKLTELDIDNSHGKLLDKCFKEYDEFISESSKKDRNRSVNTLFVLSPPSISSFHLPSLSVSAPDSRSSSSG